MARRNRKRDKLALDQFKETPDDQGLSLDELSESFARLLGEGDVPYDADQIQPDSESPTDAADEKRPVDDVDVAPAESMALDGRAPDDCPVSPDNIIEAILFVGHPQNEPISSRQIASLMRGVRAAEVESTITQLNANYVENNCPYVIESVGKGFRMVLRPELDVVREHFYGRIREAQLTQTAINTLAIVAYHQPLQKNQIVEMSGEEKTGRVLSQLVRRGLVCVTRSDDQASDNRSKASDKRSQETDKVPTESSKGRPKGTAKRRMVYQTTDRFLDLFGLDSLADLPQTHDLGDE
jgi:segregation and condensation protein B